MDVIVDTSSMLFGFSSGKNVFEIAGRKYPRCRLVVSRGIIRELEGISRNKGKRGAAAKTALMAIRSRDVRVDGNTGNPDDWIAGSAARYNKAVVITNDSELGMRLDRSGRKAVKLSRSGILRA